MASVFKVSSQKDPASCARLETVHKDNDVYTLWPPLHYERDAHRLAMSKLWTVSSTGAERAEFAAFSVKF